MNIRYAVRVFAIKEGKIVCIRYDENALNSGFYDIPGGKIEEGETEIEACKREFKEETGMSVDDLRCIGKVITKYPERVFSFKIYVAGIVEGKPCKKENNDIYWMPIEDLRKQKKRFAVTHVLDEEFMQDFKDGNINVEFTCDKEHNILITENKI